ncbi:hypothetical protein AXX16_2106 [Serratia rubidaea]|nr:hypothetical protein AXX16_2106 [Serratia rubidaea]
MQKNNRRFKTSAISALRVFCIRKPLDDKIQKPSNCKFFSATALKSFV